MHCSIYALRIGNTSESDPLSYEQLKQLQRKPRKKIGSDSREFGKDTSHVLSPALYKNFSDFICRDLGHSDWLSLAFDHSTNMIYNTPIFSHLLPFNQNQLERGHLRGGGGLNGLSTEKLTMRTSTKVRFIYTRPKRNKECFFVN